MMDIGAWLRTLHLSEYEDSFRRNRIDGKVLRDLTDQDLRDLGVEALGHRKLLLREIAALDGQSSEITNSKVVTASTSSLWNENAERRQLTILFCDLVGSTQLSQQLDPEALRDLMKRYQQACREIFQRYDGHVGQYLGDGMMVYFGWPRAHEDDAERATRAALEVLDAIKSVQAPSPLQVRIGVATGPVVVGETGAGDASVPNIAVGETPNLAARLQGLAGSDEVIIAPGTKRLLGRTFELIDRGLHALKGIVAPVSAFQVTGVAVSEGRFDAMRSAQLTPFVGREEEISLLVKRWESAIDGEGQAVLLSGEAGIGKSRVMQEFLARITVHPHVRHRYQCSPYHTNSAFFALIEYLERAAGFSKSDDNESRLSKLETVLATSSATAKDLIPLAAALLSVNVEGRYSPLRYSAQRQKEETIRALCEHIVVQSKLQPLLLIIEDVHWVDPSTLEWLDGLMRRLSSARVLMLITFRPEFKSRWTEHHHVTFLTMNRLGRRQADVMALRISGGKSLPQELLAHIVTKTDGVPLFVEEMTKAFLEGDALEEVEGGYRLKRPLNELTIPSTLQDALMARLDRLPAGKEVAQIGACIGREFSFDLLSALALVASSRIEEALRQLVDAGLIHRGGDTPDATFIFKHALVQDVAY